MISFDNILLEFNFEYRPKIVQYLKAQLFHNSQQFKLQN